MSKKIYSLVAGILLTASVWAQAPQKMSYQAVIRNSSNALLTSTPVGMQISILQGMPTGTVAYSEIQTVSTNANGLVSLAIGTGTAVSGSFAGIDWANGPYFIKTETDPTGGTAYSITGTNELMSVPYALHAKTADNGFSGNYNDLTNQPTIPTVPTTVSSFTNDAGYLTSFTEVDGSTTNELQTLTQVGSTVTLSNGGGTVSINDADASSTNEIQTISRTGTTVTLSNGGGTFTDSVGVYAAGTGISITGNVISTTNPCSLTIGQSYQGGIIFYLDASGCHGLISAPSDQSTGIQWYNGANTDTYSSGSGLFDGDGNCYRIRRSQGDCASCNAAEVCLDISLGGYSDWYLPSKYELNLMYLNIGQGNALGLGNVGNFANVGYWSSMEGDIGSAWALLFFDGTQTSFGKASAFYVRAVRAF